VSSTKAVYIGKKQAVKTTRSGIVRGKSMQSTRHVRRKVRGAFLVAAAMLTCAGSAYAETPKIPAPQPLLAQSIAAYAQAWEEAGLAFTKALFTEAAAGGYGQYSPRASAIYADGETISVYTEPVGYGFEDTGNGYRYALTANFRLLNPTGQVLASQDGFARFEGEARSMKRELPASLSFQFGGLPAGDYTLETTLADQVGGKSATFSLPFSIKAAE
jgi:hypothetical protein